MFLPDKNLMPTEAPATHAPFTLGSLIAWLETMPPDQSYQFMCTDGSCLIGQYSEAIGFGHLSYAAQARRLRAVGPMFVYSWGKTANTSVAEQTIAFGSPRTFGSALSRARKYVAGTP